MMMTTHVSQHGYGGYGSHALYCPTMQQHDWSPVPNRAQAARTTHGQIMVSQMHDSSYMPPPTLTPPPLPPQQQQQQQMMMMQYYYYPYGSGGASTTTTAAPIGYRKKLLCPDCRELGERWWCCGTRT